MKSCNSIAEKNNADIVAGGVFSAVDTAYGIEITNPGNDTGTITGGKSTKESREQFLAGGEVSSGIEYTAGR